MQVTADYQIFEDLDLATLVITNIVAVSETRGDARCGGRGARYCACNRCRCCDVLTWIRAARDERGKGARLSSVGVLLL